MGSLPLPPHGHMAFVLTSMFFTIFLNFIRRVFFKVPSPGETK